MESDRHAVRESDRIRQSGNLTDRHLLGVRKTGSQRVRQDQPVRESDRQAAMESDGQVIKESDRVRPSGSQTDRQSESQAGSGSRGI
jgi:hypothetical protein